MTIENSNGNTILQTSEGGSLLAPDHGGAIPASGAGTRMMWYPSKAAFRAGEVDGSQWDDSNIGNQSVAFGDDTEASGGWSMAVGDRTVASGTDAVAMNWGATASNTDATAMGYYTTASGPRSVAMGYETTASGQRSVAMGRDTEASGPEATAMGNSTTASGEQSAAMGENTTASGSQSVAMGLDTEATGLNSVAMGTMTDASGENAVAMGFGTRPGTDHALITGRCETGSGLFVVGNGTINSAGDACDSFSDALDLDTNGDMEIAGSLSENSDRRLKTDIQPLGEEILGALREIDPVRFHFKDERTHPAGEQIGLIAQEVQSEFPELVSEGDDGMLSLSYTKFSAVLPKGLQEQQSTINQQEERIATLEAENKEIKERLAALEAQESSPAAAGLMGSWGLALLLGLGGLAGGVLWRRRS